MARIVEAIGLFFLSRFSVIEIPHRHPEEIELLRSIRSAAQRTSGREFGVRFRTARGR